MLSEVYMAPVGILSHIFLILQSQRCSLRSTEIVAYGILDGMSNMN